MAHRLGGPSHDRLKLLPEVVHRIKALADLDNVFNVPIELIDARAALGQVL